MKEIKKESKLEKIFSPESVAVIGASRDETSVGYGILKNLVRGCVFYSEYCRPFKGRIYAVNPNADEILGVKCHPNIVSIKENIDLAIICVPAKICLQITKECIKKKVKGIILISAGFAEIGEQGKKMQNEIKKIVQNAKIPLIGPNCLGIIRPSVFLNASFAPSMPPAGKVAFISQSGALADSIIDWAIEKRYGFSKIISYGNRADVDVHDLIDYLADDAETSVISIYLEGLEDGRKFIEAAKSASKIKPIVIIKAGKTNEGVKAISSHTGSLAGSYEIYKAAFRQSNLILAETIEDLFDIAKALSYLPVCKKNSIAIVTNGGGCGVLCADYCSELGVQLAELKKSTIEKLEKTNQMHPAYSKRNPLDLVGDALPERYAAAINTLLAEDYIHGVIVIQTLQTMTSPEGDAKVIIEAKQKFPGKPIICVYMGGKHSQKGRALLEANGIPDYNDLRKAARAMWALIERGKLIEKK